MIVPKRASVKPRVVSPETHEELLLEDVIESCIAEGHCGAVELVGGLGTGKSTALAHLASLAFADRLLLLDDARFYASALLLKLRSLAEGRACEMLRHGVDRQN